ncbi:MAG: glycosyltransferase family 4 protein [Planctomycetota bacterium]
MRVLLWNRADAERAPGGDTVQWRRTAAALEALDVQPTLTTDPAPALEGFDLVHLFNLQSAEAASRVAEAARARGLPLALSPIWWDLSEGRYLRRLRRKPSLRLLERALGRERCLARFRAKDARRPAGRRERAAARRLLELASVVLPNARAELLALEQAFGVPLAHKAAVVPNAVSFAPEPPGEGAPPRAGVLCAGRLHPLKNQLTLIEALVGLDAELVLAGDLSHEPYVRECRRAAARHGRCLLTGQLDHPALVARYRAARVHALPSFRETPGLASLEAAALGCAIVSTDRGSAAEYLGTDARYCDPSDPSSIRAAVEAALADPRPVSPARLARYTWERAAAATRAAYRFSLGEAVALPVTLDAPC